MSKVHMALLALGLLVVAAVLLLAVEIFLPYRPTRAEAIDEVMALAGPSPYPFSVSDLTIAETIDRVPRSVLVAYTYQKTERGAVVACCVSLRFVTRHLFLGARGYLGTGMCKTESLRGWAHPLDITDIREGSMYGLAGLVETDAEIAHVQAVWSDGRVESVPVQEGAFFFFRERDDVRVEWVVGLDAEGRELAETRRDNR